MKSLSRLIFMLLVVTLSACGGGGGGGEESPPPASTSYSVGGSVSGLSGSVVLQNNGAETLSLNANGSFSFLSNFTDLTSYSVSIVTQPTGQACSITGESGVVSGSDVSTVTVSCVDLATYSVGGSVSGLTGTVILRNNGGGDLSLSANGDFTFSEPAYDTTNYSVSVLTQPTDQICSVSNGTGTVNGSAISTVTVTCATVYSVGGSVSGLTGTVVLQNNNTDGLTLTADGSFTFATAVDDNTTYNVSVLTQPTGQNCSVGSGVGTLSGAAVTTVSVSCVDIPTYSIGGSVSGLTGTVVLQNNNTDDLTLTADGSFTFTTPIYDLTSYSVSVLTQPIGQNCTVDSGGDGILSGAAVTTVVVSCADIPTYSIGGSVSGLIGTVVLQNNNADDLTLTADGSFTFTTPIYDLTAYSVSVLTHPATQSCTVTDGAGSLNGAAITTVSVLCADIPKYSIGGTVTGLSAGVALNLTSTNGVTDSILTSSENFVFTNKLESLDTYTVTLGESPVDYTCAISSESGTVATSDVTSISVTCNLQHKILFTVSSLPLSVKVINNGVDMESISTVGSYSFLNGLIDGETYNVTTVSPRDQACTVTNGSGTVSGADITNIDVSCYDAYTVGGTVTGLTGMLALDINGGDTLTVNADGSFAFASPLLNGSNYSVVVSTQPENQVCTVSNSLGAIASTSVTNVSVSCVSTYTVGGTVSGLTGDLQLQNNDSEILSISADGGYTFATSVVDGGTYSISVASQPSGLVCVVSNNNGVISSSDITDVDVACTTRNVALTDLGLTTNYPSIVVMPIHASDKSTGLSTSGLRTSDFTVLQDGSPVGVESFVTSKPVGDVNYVFRTVVVMDISSSIEAPDFASVKAALQTYVTSLQANQELAIYTFDATVSLVQNFTSDKDLLSTSIDSIARGGASTNLYGAISTAAGNMNDVFNLDGVVYNTMVIITDGDDTSGVVSKATAQAAVQNKKAYVVPVGTAAVVDSPLYLSLVDIFGESQILLSADFSVLESTLNTVRNNLLDYFKGLYYVYYASPSRAGTHTIDLSVVGNTNVAADKSITGSFYATNFYDVVPSIEITGESSLLNSSITWGASTLWSNDTVKDYTWTTVDGTGAEIDASNILSLTVNGDSSTATLTNAGNLEGQVIVKVTDNNWTISLTKTINVTVDTDSDGVVNSLDTDDDNDGVLDGNDDLPYDSTESVDTDGDGIGNNADTDDDNDGVLDVNDAFPFDASESADNDGDGIGNNADTDDDNDGVLDVDDAFPFDASESVDTDGDTIGNNADTDDDNDGIEDTKDFYPLDSSKTLRDFVNLNELSGNNGFRLNGDTFNDRAGHSVSDAGDINGDGIGDLIIGAIRGDFNSQTDTGISYVVFGSSSSWSTTIDLSSLDGSNGFALGSNNQNLGWSVSGAGDINGDGIDDLIIGAPKHDANGQDSGESFVVFGSNAVWPASINLSSLDGSNGFAVIGASSFDASGVSVSGAGDINGDGIDDIIIGANTANIGLDNVVGESYVVFGSNTAWPASINLISLDGSNGFILRGIDYADYSGVSVSGLGDINGDGIGDLIIGADRADPNGVVDAGESYVVFGSNAAWPSSMNLSTLDGSNGFVLNGYGGSTGISVSDLGDINGDGVDDLIIGSGFSDKSFIVFGSSAIWPSNVELSSLNGNNGFMVQGGAVDSGSGYSVNRVGDFNGDGINDVIIGTNSSSTGISAMIFGSSDAWPASIDLSTLNGSNGFLLQGLVGSNYSGWSVSGAGDINGDGLDDLIIGAVLPLYGPHVVFGCNYTALNHCQK